MKKLLVIAILMLALVFTVVACTTEPVVDETSADTTVVENPTEAPTAEPTDEVTPEPTDESAEDPTEDTTDESTEEPTTEEITSSQDTVHGSCPVHPGEDCECTAPQETTADPAEPALLVEPNEILSAATAPNAHNVGVGEVTTEGSRTFLRLTATGTDPYFTLIHNAGTLPQYLAISYRTDCPLPGEFFVGSGTGPSGQGDRFDVEWVNDGTWNLMVIDLSATGVTSIQDGNINYLRLDFFTDIMADKFFDIQYAGFFNTVEGAEKYDFKVNPPYVEKDDSAASTTAYSFDTFYVNGQMYFEADGGAGDKLNAIDNTISFAVGETHDSMALRGWIGFNQPIESFGYFIDNYKMVWGDFAQDTEDPVKAAGGEYASRFQINVPLSELLSGDHFVGFVAKLADGTVVRLRKNITVDLTDDTKYTFISDVASNGDGTDLQGSDLANYFTVTYGAGDPHAVNGGLYVYGGINELYTDMDGLYAYSVAFADAASAAMMFVRGTHVVHSVDLPAPADGLYPINNYYETDGNGHMGGAGVYANIVGSRLNIYVKVYDDASTTHVALKTYAVEVEGTELTVADAGNALYFIVDDKLVATITLAGETSYDKLCDLAEGVAFVKTATVALPDGTVDTIENTLIVSAYTSQIGIAVRGATVSFSSLKVQGLSDVTVPSEFYVPVPKKNVAVGAQVDADSVENEANIAVNATDGDESTRWGALPNGVANLVVDLGQVYDLIGLDVSFESAGWEYEIALSVDGNEYSVIYSGTRHGAKMISITGEASARYIKFTRLQDDTSTHHWFSIYEVYAYVKASEDEPEAPAVEDYNVPMNTWTVSGHKAGVTAANDATHGAMVAAGGIENGALLYQGAVGVGEVDLSKYSKVIIKYGIDNSGVTQGHYDANGVNRIMLSKTDNNMTNAPADADVVASATYTLQGWKLVTIEIDLTGVDYSGPVFVAYDTLPGTFMLIGSIEFIA